MDWSFGYIIKFLRWYQTCASTDYSFYHSCCGSTKQVVEKRYYAKLCSLKTPATASLCHGFYIEHRLLRECSFYLYLGFAEASSWIKLIAFHFSVHLRNRNCCTTVTIFGQISHKSLVSRDSQRRTAYFSFDTISLCAGGEH